MPSRQCNSLRVKVRNLLGFLSDFGRCIEDCSFLIAKWKKCVCVWECFFWQNWRILLPTRTVYYWTLVFKLNDFFYFWSTFNSFKDPNEYSQNIPRYSTKITRLCFIAFFIQKFFGGKCHTTYPSPPHCVLPWAKLPSLPINYLKIFLWCQAQRKFRFLWMKSKFRTSGWGRTKELRRWSRSPGLQPVFWNHLTHLTQLSHLTNLTHYFSSF